MELIMPTLTPDERRSLMNQHRYAAGQHVSYAEHGTRGPWKGGYAIVALLPHGADEPQYRISHADQSYDRVLWEHELTEDLPEKFSAPRRRGLPVEEGSTQRAVG